MRPALVLNTNGAGGVDRRTTMAGMDFSSLPCITLLTTTVATQAEAQSLAQAAVQAHLAACVQVEPMTSHYVWQGQQEAGAEWRLVCKTTPQVAADLWQWLEQQHPYAVPQLLCRTEQASRAYADWVAQQVQPCPAEGRC